ncbi:MAG: ankyrin repeat domain-containing protein [Magnetococcales bacterium]|nr:ankyrin repeat domain-containing protein [Magnetococcales bacterium]
MNWTMTMGWRLLALLLFYLGLGCDAWAGSFHQEVFQGRLERVKKMVADKKNEVNEADGFGSTPLHHAAMGGSSEVVEWLMHNGAVLDTRDAGGNTALMLAMRGGKLEVAKMLVQAGADVQVLDNLGGGILASAAYFGAMDLVELLLDHGAKVNHANHLGLTPLHMATLANAKPVIKILLERGAEPNAKDSQGETPLNKAKDDESRQILWKMGARLEKNRDDALVEQSAPKGMEE